MRHVHGRTWCTAGLGAWQNFGRGAALSCAVVSSSTCQCGGHPSAIHASVGAIPLQYMPVWSAVHASLVSSTCQSGQQQMPVWSAVHASVVSSTCQSGQQ